MTNGFTRLPIGSRHRETRIHIVIVLLLLLLLLVKRLFVKILETSSGSRRGAMRSSGRSASRAAAAIRVSVSGEDIAWGWSAVEAGFSGGAWQGTYCQVAGESSDGALACQAVQARSEPNVRPREASGPDVGQHRGGDMALTHCVVLDQLVHGPVQGCFGVGATQERVPVRGP